MIKEMIGHCYDTVINIYGKFESLRKGYMDHKRNIFVIPSPNRQL